MTLAPLPIGFVATYYDPVSKKTYTNAWIQITAISYQLDGNFYQGLQSYSTSFQVYLSQSLFLQGKKPVVANPPPFVEINTTSDYETYFSNSICNLSTQILDSLKFILSLTEIGISASPSGFTFDFVDEDTGAEYPEAWLQVKSGVFAFQNFITISYNIYQDYDSFLLGNGPISSENSLGVGLLDVTGNWDLFFQNSICNLEEKSLDYMSYKLGV
jgi:hypothetical protein